MDIITHKAPPIGVDDLDELLATTSEAIMVYVRSDYCGPCGIVDRILGEVGEITAHETVTDSWGDSFRRPAVSKFGLKKSDKTHYTKGSKKPIRGVSLEMDSEQASMWLRSYGISEYPVLCFFNEADLVDRIIGITNNSAEITKEHMFNIIGSINDNE
jgi:hypothetical protein